MISNRAVNEAKRKLGLKYFENIEVTFNEVKSDFTVRVIKKGNKVTISYSSLCAAFRGLTLVKQHANEEEFDITLNRNFNSNGYMIDCSRNGVVKVDQLKDTVLMQALMGLDRLLLYTEDTYKLDKYPWFGYLRGGYSKDEIKEIVKYGEEFGVTLIPCIQTLGHLGRPLHWEPMIPLRDGPTTLLTGNEQVYELIEEMLKFCKECFHTNEIHIGMDESTEMGLGRYLQQNPYKDRVELFSEHLKRVISLTKKYGLEPMIWSDMYFRLGNKDEEYYRESPLPESTLKLIPEGIKLVYWDYYHSDKSIYDRMFQYHFQTKRPIAFAGGAWRWKGYTPAIKYSLINSKAALESCLENNTKEVFVTSWGDNGNESSYYCVLPVLAMYSCADYENNMEDEKIDSLLKAVTEESLDQMLLLDLPDMPNKELLLPQYNPSKYFLFQDPLLGLFDKQVKPNFAKNYAEFAGILAKASKNSKDFGYIYETLSCLCEVLSMKVDLGTRIRKAYKEKDKKALKVIANKEIPVLLVLLDKLNKTHREQWNKENKPYGFDVCDGRIGYLKNRLNTTSVVLEEYVSGKVERIPELEEEILPYNGHDYEVCWNWWLTTVTVQNL